MSIVVPEYRADHLACPLNPGKLAQVRDLVLAMRRTAGRESAWQWNRFFRGGWQRFESQAKKGWTRPWVEADQLSTSLSQMVMTQVAGSLKGYMGNVQNSYADLVLGSTLPPAIRHQLHAINRTKAWFSSDPVSVKQSVTRVSHNGKTVVREEVVVVAEAIRSLARQLIRKARAMHRRPHFRRFQPQIDQRACFVQASHSGTALTPYWLMLSTLSGQERLALPLRAHADFLERTTRSKFYTALANPTLCPRIEDGQGFLTHMQALEERDRKRRNPHASDLAVPHTVRLMLSEDHQRVTIGLVSDMRAVFDHQAATYMPLCDSLALDLGLCTFMATQDGELHGRGWMAKLERYDKILAGIARHRQRLGLKTASDRYRKNVQRLRGWLKTEIHRILNRLIDRKRPAKLILEAVQFHSPKLSRRLNRLIQNFGKGVLTRKLAEIERQFGIVVEYRESAYTSQECHGCGYVDKHNRPSQDTFHCKFCKTKVHADIHAARVLHDRCSAVETFTSFRGKRQHLLATLTRQFSQRYTRPRGGPADPRCSNPYFREWALAVRSPEAGGQLLPSS